MPDTPGEGEADDAAQTEAAAAAPEWIAQVRGAVPDGVLAVRGVPGGADADLPTLDVASGQWFEVAAALKSVGFDAFVDLCATDFPERAPRLDVVLHVRDLSAGLLARCVTQVAADGQLPSLEPLFPGAGWPEREAFDLFGVRFGGNADLRRLLLPEDWEGHPLRRDYPLTGPRALDPESRYAL